MVSNSRYDFMKEGSVQDEITGSLYPDPLSINYLNFQISSIPVKDVMSDDKIISFWEEAQLYYGKACWDDVVLTLNGVSHRNFLKSGDEIYFPKEEDIKSSFVKER